MNYPKLKISSLLLLFFSLLSIDAFGGGGGDGYYVAVKANIIGQGKVYASGYRGEDSYRTSNTTDAYDAYDYDDSNDESYSFTLHAQMTDSSNPSRYNFLGWREGDGDIISGSNVEEWETPKLPVSTVAGQDNAVLHTYYAIFSAYYARAHAEKSTSNSGGGKVYVSSSNHANPTEYVDSDATGSGNYYTSNPGGMIDFGYFAKPDDNSIFLGWSLDGDIENIVAGSDQYVNGAYKWVHPFAASTEYCIGNNDTECKDPVKNKELDHYAYAHFAAKYTITYSGEGISIPPQVYWSENKTDVLPLPSRSGFIFAGWKVKSNTGSWTQTSYPGGFPVQGMTGNVSLEAQWSQPCKVTVIVSGLETSDVAVFEISGGQFYRIASGNGNTVFTNLAIGDLVKPGEWNKKYEFTPQSQTVETANQTLTFTARKTDVMSSEDYRSHHVE